MAAITRVLGIPSDHIFAAEHWRPLTRAEAMQRNPFYTSRLHEAAHLYTCDRLGDDGRCMAYEDRPLVCRGYPWYGGAPRPMALADPDCGYNVDLVRVASQMATEGAAGSEPSLASQPSQSSPPSPPSSGISTAD